MALHIASMRLEHQTEGHTVLPQERSTSFGHSRGVPSHHRAQVVEQYKSPGHSPDSLLDPRWRVVPAQRALYAL